MTALDQAFIKAFSQQGTSAAAVVPRPAGPKSNNAKQPAGDNSSPVAPAMFDRFDNILAALEKMPNLQEDSSNSRNVVEEERALGGFPSIEVTSEQWSGGGAWGVDNESFCAPPASLVPGHEPQPSISEPQTTFPEAPFSDIESRSSSDEEQIVDAKSGDFRPAWQVDRFSWPRVCNRLISRAAGEWDRLADAIYSSAIQGQKVLAVAGCRRGEGATTMLLCAARRLAERGVKTALVDADLERPRLAKRMGVQPQIGWNEIADDEEALFDQAVVETKDGKLALSAVRDPASKSPAAIGDWSQWSACLGRLREHYDVVLVDLGPLETVCTDENTPPWTRENSLDGLILVHNLRLTAKDTLIEMQRRLSEEGVTLAGVIENFVAL
ncbi:MAG: hypothetical protein JW959_03090 [Pirellulales bacterium]|nr:hypothetical protein [Pirellulales bacterium]